MQPNDAVVVERLIMILKLCEKGGLPGKTINLEDMEALGVYLMVLKANRIDAEVLEAGTPDVLSERFFPTPGAIVERCRPHRDLIEAYRAENRMKGWIDCLDPRGGVMLAPPDCVLNGMPVKQGQGNGMAYVDAAPKSLDDSRLKALLEGRATSPMELPGRTSDDRIVIDPETELRLIEEARETRRKNGGEG